MLCQSHNIHQVQYTVHSDLKNRALTFDLNIKGKIIQLSFLLVVLYVHNWKGA